MMKSQNATQPIAAGSLPASKSQSGSVIKGLVTEAGLIASMTCYYLIGNSNLGNGWLFHVNQLYSLPFLLLFAFLCWYRLAFVVALFPLTLPYYRFPRLIYGHYSLSLAETTLLICLAVALLQLLFQRESRKYWQALGSRVGLFVFPTLVLLISALLAASLAVNRTVALRTFSQVVLEPILYLGLVLLCFRSRASLERLLWALAATGCFLALLGIIQILFFAHQLKTGIDGFPQITTVYTNGRSLGLFIDYLLPGSLALLLIGIWQGPRGMRSWGARVGTAVLCLLLLLTLYLSQALRSELALVVAFLFIVAFAFPGRAALLMSSIGLLVICAAGAIIFHTQLASFFLAHQGDATQVLRSLWESVGPLGLLAIVALVLLFFWYFRRVLVHLRTLPVKERLYMRWMTIAAGGTVIAVLAQAAMGNTFLGQDTVYLFWATLAALLLLRELAVSGQVPL